MLTSPFKLKVGPGIAVVISSPRRAKECFEQNSSTTSDRPPVHIGELVYQGIQLSLARYGMCSQVYVEEMTIDLHIGSGPHWRNMRRATHRLLSKEASQAHLPIQHAEASQLMLDITDDPKASRFRLGSERDDKLCGTEFIRSYPPVFYLSCSRNGLWRTMFNIRQPFHCGVL